MVKTKHILMPIRSNGRTKCLFPTCNFIVKKDVFRFIGAITDHIKEDHAGQCGVCFKEFYRTGAMLDHVLVMHEEIGPWVEVAQVNPTHWHHIPSVRRYFEDSGSRTPYWPINISDALVAFSAPKIPEEINDIRKVEEGDNPTSYSFPTLRKIPKNLKKARLYEDRIQARYCLPGNPDPSVKKLRIFRLSHDELKRTIITENAKFKATFRGAFGWSDPRGIFGSPGA